LSALWKITPRQASAETAWNDFTGAPAKAHLFGLLAMWPIWIGLAAAIIKVTGKDLSGYVSCGVAARQF
jgi:hypothetical protein